MTNQLELHIRKIARRLHDQQIARLYKIPNDMKIVDGQLIHAEQTPADFIGHTITGRVIVLECKMRKSPSLQIGSAGLKRHQLIAIKEAHDCGGIGLLVWQNGDRTAVIDAGQVKHYIEGRKSIAWRDIPDRYKRDYRDTDPSFFWPFITRPSS